MVNVAGRSKGCHLCRKRRVACSLDRPQCKQCVRLGRECPGYQRERVFIHVNQAPVQSRSPKRKQKSLTAPSSSNHVASVLTTYPPAQEPILRHQLFFDFVHHCAPRSFTTGYGPLWMLLYPTLSQPTLALEASLMAFCSAALGRRREDSVLIGKSLECYVRGLQALQRALCDPDLRYCEETLGAASALCMFELLECPDSGRMAYNHHQRGLAKLVELKGPDAYTSNFSHRIFCLFRIGEVCHALEQHTQTFLAKPEWQERPWNGLSKPPLEKIVDVMLAIPGLLRDADFVTGQTPRGSHARRLFPIAIRYCELEEYLLSIRRELEKEYEGELGTPRISILDNPTDDPVLGKLFPTVYSFSDAGLACTMLLYWTTLIMIGSGLYFIPQYVQDELAKSGDSDAAYFGARMPDAKDHKSWGKIGHEACRCAEYLLQEPVSIFMHMSLSGPMHILRGYYLFDDQFEREVRWIHGVLTQVHRRGMRSVPYFSQGLTNDELHMQTPCIMPAMESTS